MKIAIISDLHDNLTNLKKFLQWSAANKINTLIVCGDICAPATLKKIATKFQGPIHIVFGNVGDRPNELKVASNFKHVKHYKDLGEFKINNKKIAINHYPQEAKQLARSNKYDFVFYGHSHKPWIEAVGQTVLANPGTLGGMFYQATFAVWNTTTNKLELKILTQL